MAKCISLKNITFSGGYYQIDNSETYTLLFLLFTSIFFLPRAVSIHKELVSTPFCFFKPACLE